MKNAPDLRRKCKGLASLLPPHCDLQMEKRPALRALERVVSEEGFKTVVTLRLAPVLPIPLGAYNYGESAVSCPSLLRLCSVWCVWVVVCFIFASVVLLDRDGVP